MSVATTTLSPAVAKLLVLLLVQDIYFSYHLILMYKKEETYILDEAGLRANLVV